MPLGGGVLYYVGSAVAFFVVVFLRYNLLSMSSQHIKKASKSKGNDATGSLGSLSGSGSLPSRQSQTQADAEPVVEPAYLYKVK